MRMLLKKGTCLSFITSQLPTLVTVIIWSTMIMYFQYVDPYLAISRCEFPKVDSAGKKLQFSKVLLIADPQLIDQHTYPSRSSVLLKLSKLTVDNYIYKNYISLIRILEPDMIVFLGDLMDNGRESSDDYYEGEFGRFNRIFLNPIKSRQIEVITGVPGNHDIGWANGVTQHSLERFNRHFGASNKLINLQNHDLILLDDVTMTNTENESLSRPIYDFLKGMRSSPKQRTRILMQHVTLWRDHNVKTCGPERESKNLFPISKGYQYQTVIDEAHSMDILKSVKPDIVFNGDDHDYCEVVHTYDDDDGIERSSLDINVKSMSMAMGIWKPAVELLTLYHDPVELKADWVRNGQILKHKGEQLDYSFDTCYLAAPYTDVALYITLAVVTSLWILANSVQHKKRYVSLTEQTVYENSVIKIIQSIAWYRFLRLAAINFMIVLGLYLAATFV